MPPLIHCLIRDILFIELHSSQLIRANEGTSLKCILIFYGNFILQLVP